MADSHLDLAPLIEPPLPRVLSVPAAETLSVTLLLAAVLLALGLVAMALWWWRRAPQRALRNIAREPDAPKAAEQLAQWQRRHSMQANAEWLQALDRLRFGPHEQGAHDMLQRLCGEAAVFSRPGS